MLRLWCRSTVKRMRHSWQLQNSRTMSCSPVFVYQGLGANERCRNVLYKSLVDNVDPRKHTVSFITPSEIIAGVLQESRAALLAIGGGYDLGFLGALGSEGVAQISSYVRGGGAYLGICAGGYFACDCISFDKGGPLEVCGKRDLQFFPGLCEGPAYPGFQYQSEVGAFASELSFSSPNPEIWLQFHVYFNGGGQFLLHDPPAPEPKRDSEHSHSLTDESAFALSQEVSKRNGFRRDVLGLNHSSVPVASMHCDSKARESLAEDCQQTETQGKGLSASFDRHVGKDDVTVLATYSELEGKPAAIVKSCVGLGVVVLSGAHIEYDVAALPSDVHISRIREKLVASEKARTSCFRCCLQHLNLCLS